MRRVLQALEPGPIPARVLTGDATGSVAAAFESSFYVDLAGALVCFGAHRFPIGPINVRTSVSSVKPFSAVQGMPVSVRGHVPSVQNRASGGAAGRCREERQPSLASSLPRQPRARSGCRGASCSSHARAQQRRHDGAVSARADDGEQLKIPSRMICRMAHLYA